MNTCLKTCVMSLEVYETEMESEVGARVAGFYREFCNCDMCEEELWKDSMKEGGSKDLLERVERALTAQSPFCWLMAIMQ